MREKKCHQESHKSGKSKLVRWFTSKRERLTPNGNHNHCETFGVSVIQLAISFKTYMLVLVLAMLYLIESQRITIDLNIIIIYFKILVYVAIIEVAYILYNIILKLITKYKK